VTASLYDLPYAKSDDHRQRVEDWASDQRLTWLLLLTISVLGQSATWPAG